MKIINNISERLGDDLKQTLGKGSKVSIAASYFSLYAYEALMKELKQVDEVRFLFTSPTFVPDAVGREKREFYIPKRSRENSLYGTAFEIRLKNELNQKAIARECGEWIRRKVKFKSNRTEASMPGMLNVQSEGEALTYTPLNGFGTVELGYEKGGALASLVHRFDEAEATGVYMGLFDEVWNDKNKLEDVTQQVAEQISSVYKENSPEFVYYAILYNIFNEFLSDLNEDVLPNEATGFKESAIWNRLYPFQKDAVIGSINKLEKFGGCILADSVGLGKTFSALGVIKYYELRNKSVLVLCPKKLGDNWMTYRQPVNNNVLAADRLRYDVLYHTDVSRDRGYSNGMPLDRLNWGNYDLLVIDESHNFRNNEAKKNKETRYQKLMNKVIKSGVRTKVLMLSATPVNNRFIDLRNQLALAYEGDPEQINARLDTDRGIDDIFRRAQSAFNQWSKLDAQERTTPVLLGMLDFDFFELLDSLTIARSRTHIQKYYDTEEIGEFPKRRVPLSEYCAITELEGVPEYEAIFAELSKINLGIYAPFQYIQPSRMSFYENLYDTRVKGGGGSFRQIDREGSLQILMRINLLKRLESSVESFRLTLGKIVDNLERNLERADEYERSRGEAAETNGTVEYSEPEEADLDNDDWLDDEFSIGKNVKINLADIDLLRWKEDLEHDRHILAELLDEMMKVTPEHDKKLNVLKEIIDKKIREPINEGNRKVIVFSAFSDTAGYLYTHLSSYMKEKYGIESAKITGSDENKNTAGLRSDIHTLLTCFSPRSKEKHLTMPLETRKLDLLIATDCISEGQNLQDCDYLVNYDIHWNPVRIIQRFGRVDRIGSRNKQIQLVNFWPDLSLDEYINLKARVENRMVIMDMTATGDDNVLFNRSSDLEYRKRQLDRLQEEVVDLDEMDTGVSITDLGLNDFRMDLVGYVKENGGLDSVPGGLHAVVGTDGGKGISRPGVIYVLRNIDQELDAKRQNRLHPFYLVYIGENGEVVTNHLDVKKTLDVLRALCRGQVEPVIAACRDFNEETRDGRNMRRYSRLLEEAVLSIVQVKEEGDLDSLFSAGGTTALLDSIRGLEDFELLSFVVIRDMEAAAESTERETPS
ncbi:helicase-related protein [Saccharibacillus sp. CPCC 101409]|uniref:helicase-related protein n=1 Tax=Saccharibacillus sp. CPCC 101409 TaxID=3058041 RepID=UPI0026718773|nr:helicase-related protein [Saccharibacillus sp. CPCC 101409]MDO3409887.1 helicase-related protein [Saccharibacillus sp. CPCC 101409]